jgi:hypothetical protein
MLQLGQNITSANDPLKKIENEVLFRMVGQPGGDLQSKINQLRTVAGIQPQRYQALKKMLPYVTCGIFHPAYRRLENFASIDCFILDLDHLSEKELMPLQLKEKLKSDPNIQLAFTSPGNNGLKLLFTLEKKCYDRHQFSMFYKLFVRQFSAKHGLDQVVDKVTSDATRACFLSVDAEAWFNPQALPVRMESIIDFDSHLAVESARTLLREMEQDSPPVAKEKENPLTSDLLTEIKKKLNPNFKTKPEKTFFVPQEVDQAIEKVEEKVRVFGIELKESASIHYGRKMVFTLEDRWAQLNLFFGKNGYKIVKTPVNKSDPELAEVVYGILCEYFFGPENPL